MATAFNPEKTVFPSDLQDLFDQSVRSDEQAGKIFSGLSDEQLNWRPDGGRGWSIAQCLDHLAKTNSIYAPALEAAMRRPGLSPRRGPIQPGWLEGYFIRTIDAPPRRKFKAPKTVLPASDLKGEKVLADFHASHQLIRDALAKCGEIDLNRIRFKNPFFGLIRFTVGAGFQIVAAHDRRHLWQALQVRSSLGLTKSM
jgi:hypothetical protein